MIGVRAMNDRGRGESDPSRGKRAGFQDDDGWMETLRDINKRSCCLLRGMSRGQLLHQAARRILVSSDYDSDG